MPLFLFEVFSNEFHFSALAIIEKSVYQAELKQRPTVFELWQELKRRIFEMS